MRINLSLKYAISIILVLLVALATVFTVISRGHEKLVMTQLEMQARALFQQIVITRRWVADHGGVFVEKLPGVQPNPYLADPLMKARGKDFIKENPAMVTKQLSQYAQREGLYFFHITSLKLMNPHNAPDEFEIKALRDFEAGTKTEAMEREKIGESYYYRYIAPLHVEEACLDCHARQGYKIGDIRGAISVSVPMDYAMTVMDRERALIVAGVFIIGAVLMLALFLVTRRLVLSPIRQIRGQMREFSANGTARIDLIRTGDELEELSRSFQDMAKSIDEYHGGLQEKISAATKELTAKNEALVKMHHTKSDFVAKISHDLRTPLTAIKGAMDYLSVKMAMRDSEEDQDLLVFFEMVKKNADRLIRLVNNVLDYERIGMGAFEMRFRELNVKDLLRDEVAAFRPLASEKNVSIRIKAMDAVISADEDRIKQVLTNLLSNALDVAPPSSQILVNFESRGQFVYCAVEDSGPGVPEAEREEVFREFYSTKTNKGTGLGLAICKGIIEAHGGEIGVEDSELGGSRFWFMIPITQNRESVDEKTAAVH